MENHFAQLANLHISIVGLGLMGGSLALALEGRCKRLSGVEPGSEARRYAVERGLVDEIISLEQAMDSDLLVLAAPVSAILAILETMRQYNPHHPEVDCDCVVLDLGSTKQVISAAMQALPAGFDPIGGHPMCGKELSGVEHAEAGLYEGKTFILTSLERTSSRARSLALALVQALGAQPLFLQPAEHDRLAAFASHLPYLAAVSLVQAAQAAGDERIWQVVASGFRDATRLAVSDLAMMCDIIRTNPEPVLEALTGVRVALDNLAEQIASGDDQALAALLLPARQQRSQLFRS